jgi:hypothetical protein
MSKPTPELYAAAKAKGFSKDNVDQLMNFSRTMASKVIKSYLLEAVDEAARLHEITEYERAKAVPAEKTEIYAVWKRLRSNISKIKAENFSGYQEMTFEADGVTYRLRMQLSIVPHNYELEIRLPEKIAPEFFKHLDNLTGIAMQYYHVEAKNIIKDLAIMFPDDDVSSLGLNKNNRTLCLAQNGIKRIGALCFFVDAQGKPLTEM